jgi:DNA repair protein RecO (recombination protein O)
MERWNDQGIVLGVRGHGEGGAVATLLTERHGKYAGYVHGGHSSQRLRAQLQPGTLAQVEWSAQTIEQLGTFSIEDSQSVNPAFLDDAAALCALQSVCALTDRSVPERESHPALFAGTSAFLGVLGYGRNVWGAALVFWELALLREMGFGLDLSKCVATGETEDLHYVSPKSGGAVSEGAAGQYKDRLLPLPGFLRGEGQASEADILAGLKLSGHFIEHRLFAQTTHILPEARQRLIEFFDINARDQVSSGHDR